MPPLPSLKAQLVSGGPTLMAGISLIRSVKAAILRLRSAFSSARRRLSRSFRCSKNISSRSDEEVIACSRLSLSSLSCKQRGVQSSEEMTASHPAGAAFGQQSEVMPTQAETGWLKQVPKRHPFCLVCRLCGVLQALPSRCNRCAEIAREQQPWHEFFWQRGSCSLLDVGQQSG